MLKLGWMTDIHLDRLESKDHVEGFCRSLADVECDAYVLTGDISHGRQVEQHLLQMAHMGGKRIYFVLGNHDFWYSDIATVRHYVSQDIGPNLVYLSTTGVHQLTDSVALVGHDTWYDARLGSVRPIKFRMFDWGVMNDYTHAGAAWLRKGNIEAVDEGLVIDISRKIAEEGVAHIDARIVEAIAAGNKTVVVATHVPGFEDANFHEGRKSHPITQPWFTCKALGDVLTHHATLNPDVKFISLSGHTHSSVSIFPMANLEVHVGEARYKFPQLQRVFEF